MTAPKRFSPEMAEQLLHDHELDFLDLCQLLLVFAQKVEGDIKWDHPRLVVWIRARARKPRRSCKSARP